MASYLTLFLYLLGAEITRRIIVSVVNGVTGPLTKIPGPFSSKFTDIIWKTYFLRQKTARLGDAWIQKYGPVVRVGESIYPLYSYHGTSLTIIKAPSLVLIADKDAIRKVLSEIDMKKGPVYDDMRLQPDVASLFTETDKASYKIAVWT